VHWILVACALVGCGKRARAPEGPAFALPETVSTELGPMNTEEQYLPGVVDCEMAHYTAAPAALDAQAIAARTYLARYLYEHGAQASIAIGPRFQCWRDPVHERSREAARRTRGVLLRHHGELITANYAAGASGLDDACAPPGPDSFGYPGGSWEVVRRAWVVKSERQAGPAWTEIFVTRNGGKRGAAVTPSWLGPQRPENRGALGQHAAICLAERHGLGRDAVLRHFYGDDVRVE